MGKTEPLLKYMHISVDDVYCILKELTEGSYQSIYEHKVLKFLKNMHDKYGAVFSFYCFYHISDADGWTLANMTNRFRDEFKTAASWLKFGFHSNNSTIKYNEMVIPDEALKHYNDVINAIKNFAGSSCVDRIPRIHFFSAAVENVRKWRDANDGVEGFLAADDNRELNYYLNDVERSFLQNHSCYFEAKENLYFLKTNFRLENIENAYKLLELEKQHKYAHEEAIKIVFTHEKFLYTDEIMCKIEDCCRWAIDNNYVFAFPMENILRCITNT